MSLLVTLASINLDSCKLQVGGVSKVEIFCDGPIKVAAHFNKDFFFLGIDSPTI
jgi:hypothetical protein